jgi:hypothetical protein
MEKSREHQEQNLQREYQGKNQELTQMLIACQMQLASQVWCCTQHKNSCMYVLCEEEAQESGLVMRHFRCDCRHTSLPVMRVMRTQIDQTHQLQRDISAMYTQEHIDKLEREIQKANLLLIKVQSKWQQAQMAAAGGSAAAAGAADGGGSTPRPDWEEAREKLPGLQVPHDSAAAALHRFRLTR